MPLPNLIIVGVHKAGTTSLFTYLNGHTQIDGSSRKELHYFTPLRYGKELDHISNYEKYFENCRDVKYLLEASPSYLYGDLNIIRSMKKTLSNHKLIVVLRDPVKRFISFYHHLKSKFLIDDSSFKDFMEKCFHVESKTSDKISNNYYERALREGIYEKHLHHWIEEYGENFKILFFEDLVSDPKTTLIDLCDFLEIDSDFYENYDFTVENQSQYSKNHFMHRLALGANNNLETFFRANPRLKFFLRKIYFGINKGKKEDLGIDTKRLEAFYKSHNANLNQLLNNHGLKTSNWSS